MPEKYFTFFHSCTRNFLAVFLLIMRVSLNFPPISRLCNREAFYQNQFYAIKAGLYFSVDRGWA